MEADIQRKVKIGLKWNLINQIVTQCVFVWFGIYLARILGPGAYGLVGMITVFSGFANIFVDFGFSSAIIYFKDLNQLKLSSVFWFNFSIGILIYLAFFWAGPFLAKFYHEPELSGLTRLVTISILINSVSSVQNALLSKKIDFKKKIQASWVSMIVSYLLAFILAYNGFGVYSLVAQMLVNSCINSLFLWNLTTWRPIFHFSFKDVRPLLTYGSSVAGTNMLGYLTRNVDNLIIGKVLGTASLGLYTRSYSLMMLPITNITSVFSKVLFPAFSKIQDDINALSNYYRKIVKYIALVTFPMMFGLCSLSREFVYLFLGQKWSEAIPLIQMLSFLGAFQSILSLNGILYNSTGNAHKALKVTIYLNLALIPAWITGVYFDGLRGLVLAYLLVGTVGTFPIWAIALKLVNLKVWDILNDIKFVVISCISLLVVNFFVSYLPLSFISLFVVKLFMGIFAYILSLRWLEREIFFLIKGKVLQLLSLSSRGT